MLNRTTTKVVISIVILVLFSVGAPHVVWAGDVTADSSISQVTVYPGAARVTRQAELDLAVGEHSIVFDDIIPRLDENSLTVAGEGTAGVKIFGAYIKREYLKETADARVKELMDLIQELDDQLGAEKNNLDVLSKEKEYLDSVKLYAGQQIPKDLVTAMPTVENLDNIRKFLADRYTEVQRKKEAINIKVRNLKEEKKVAQQQLNELRSHGNKQQRKMVVDLECTRAGSFVLDVSYLVHGANWRSVYDARAKYDDQEVELTSFGMIKQATGEDWENVQLTLSTAQPTIGGRMPYVAPWMLQPYEPRKENRMVSRGLMKTAAPMAQGVQYEAYDLDNEMVADAVMEEATMAYSQVEQKGVSIVYNVVRPVTIKSDGSESRYPISTQVLKAKFKYSTYPRSKPFAYLGSRVMNAEDMQLLAGQVNLFLDDDYIGKSSIDNIGPGEDFDLYLGIDENVKVEREQISKNVDDILIGGIKSPNRTTTFEYKLTVENYKGKDIDVILFEAMPVSQNDRVKVKIGDVSMKPKEKDWKDRQGVWRWEFSLKPKKKQEITYSFSVEHSRDMNVPGI